MYCRNCGHEVKEGDTFCPNCGSLINDENNFNNNINMHNVNYNTIKFVDRGNPLLGICSFFIPVMGLILFIVWRKIKPISAKHAGMGSLVFLGFLAFFLIVYMVGLVI